MLLKAFQIRKKQSCFVCPNYNADMAECIVGGYTEQLMIKVRKIPPSLSFPEDSHQNLVASKRSPSQLVSPH